MRELGGPDPIALYSHKALHSLRLPDQRKKTLLEHSQRIEVNTLATLAEEHSSADFNLVLPEGSLCTTQQMLCVPAEPQHCHSAGKLWSSSRPPAY